MAELSQPTAMISVLCDLAEVDLRVRRGRGGILEVQVRDAILVRLEERQRVGAALERPIAVELEVDRRGLSPESRPPSEMPGNRRTRSRLLLRPLGT